MITVGFPRMHKEAGERRDFLPALMASVARAGARVVIESGLGKGLGLTDGDYRAQVPDLQVATTREAAWAQSIVVVLRSPEVEEFDGLIHPRTTVVSMLHLPTRPRRLARLRALQAFAVSLDGLADDDGVRLVENTRAVGWNGLEAAFTALERFNPQRLVPSAPALQVTVLGAGQVGKHAAEAAIKYGSRDRWTEWSARGVPPVAATLVGRRIVASPALLEVQLRGTDVLVDATQRDRSDVALISNAALASLPPHAVICDLNVDPYVPTGRPPTVRGLEGIPMGNLDQWLFSPDDEHWNDSIPAQVPQAVRRAVVSCYSWPGLRPRECMELYGRQLEPFLVRLVQRGGGAGLPSGGDAIDRALWRAGLEAREVPTEEGTHS